MATSSLGLTAASLALQGLVAGTEVLTATGMRAVEHLRAGDRAVTRSGMRVVRGVSTYRVDQADMVRIGVDMLGVGRPDSGVLVPAGQGILIRDWRAQALFGTPQVVVPAVRLVDGQMIRTQAVHDVDLYEVRFDDHEVIYAAGLELSFPRVLALA